MASGSVKSLSVLESVPIIETGAITSGSVDVSSSSAPATAFAITYTKTFTKVPLVYAIVYTGNSDPEKGIFVRTISNLSATGCVINISNPYTAAQSLSGKRRVNWVAIQV